MNNLESFGNWGYQLGAVGILVFTVSYLVVVKRWWKDVLGRTIGLVLITMSCVLFISTFRMRLTAVGMEFFTIRLIIFWAFGLAVWWGLLAFIWAQFFAPRIHDRTTRKEQDNA